MGPIASPDNPMGRYFNPVLGDFINVLISALPAFQGIQIGSRKLHPGSALTHQPFDDCSCRVSKAYGNRQPPQMIEDDCHWKPLKQAFMRHDLGSGPVELQMPAEHFYPGCQRFNHVKRGWCVLWRIKGETDAANPLLVEQGKRRITDVWAQYRDTTCTVEPHLRNGICRDGVVRIVISGRYHDGAVDS